MKDLSLISRFTKLTGHKPTLGATLFLVFFSASLFVLYFFVSTSGDKFTILNTLLRDYEIREELTSQFQAYDQQLTKYTADFLESDDENRKREIRKKYNKKKKHFNSFSKELEKGLSDTSAKKHLKDLKNYNDSLVRLELEIFNGERDSLGSEYLEYKSLYSKSLNSFSQNLNISPGKRLEILDFISQYDKKRKELLIFLFAFWAIFGFVFYYINNMRTNTLREYNKQNRFLETLINKVQSGVVAVNSKGEFILWNDAASKILGKNELNSPPEQWPELYRVFNKDESEKTLTHNDLPLYRALKGETVENEELAIKRPDGTTTISCFSTPLCSDDEEREIDGAVIIFSDVTSQKLLEVERQKKFHAFKMATLGEVSGNLAHEVNTPLCTMKLAAEFIHLGIRKKDFDKVQRFTGYIEDAVERISSIVEAFKRYSRQEKVEPTLEVTSLNQCIEESLNLCSIDFSHEGIDVIKNYSDEDHLLCECSSSHMVQLFVNLFVNAKDAIAELDEKWIEISMTHKKGKAIVMIKDSGKGIDQETRRNMYDPFFSTKNFGRSTGMGLWMAKNIARMHNGEIYSTLIDGHTCFVFEMDLFHEKELNKAS